MSRSIVGQIIADTDVIRSSPVPTVVLERTRHAVLDYVGVVMAGLSEPSARIAREVLTPADGRGGATALGAGRRGAPRDIAMVNAISAHALDFDDSSKLMLGHASAPVASAVLAVAEERDLGSSRVTQGMLAGFQAQARVGCHTPMEFTTRGFHGSGVMGAIGAAAGAAVAIGLDSDRLVAALGLAATQGAGLTAVFGSMGKHLNVGRAAAAGVLAAHLAERGFDAPERAVEQLIVSHAGTIDTSYARNDGAELGPFDGVRSIFFKAHACCHMTHSPLENVRSLRSRSGWTMAEVRRIRHTVSDAAVAAAGIAVPTSGAEGKFSIRYTSALAALGLRTDASGFTDALVFDPHVRGAADLVEVETDGDMAPTAAARTEIVLRSGEVLTESIDVQSAWADDRLDEQGQLLHGKFVHNVTPVLDRDRAESILQWVDDIHLDRPVRELADLTLAPGSTRALPVPG